MTTPHRRRHAAAFLCATVAVAGLALGACSASPHLAPVADKAPATQSVTVPATTPAPARSATTPTTPAPRATAVPAARPATPADPAGIPWSSVRAGWTVVETGQSPSNPTTGRLQLVSPYGARYTLATLPWVDLQDVSPDGRRLLATRDGALREMDLVSRAWRTIPSPKGGYGFRYTRPSGSQIIARVGVGSGLPSFIRFDRAGRTTLSLDLQDGAYAPSGDGRFLVTGWFHQPLVVRDNATGAVLRTVPTPGGYHDCVPAGTYSAPTTVAVRCDKNAPNQAYVSDVFLLDASTGGLRAVTHATGTGDETYGYVAALATSQGTLVMRGTGCGPGDTGLVTASGHLGTALVWPQAVQTPSIAGAVGRTVYATYTTCNGDDVTLRAQDLVTHQVRTLVTAPFLQARVIQE